MLIFLKCDLHKLKLFLKVVGPPLNGGVVPGIGQYLRQLQLQRQDSSFLHYEDVSGTVRDPGDGQQKEEEDIITPLASHEENMEIKTKPVQDQVRAGSTGLNPFKGKSTF